MHVIGPNVSVINIHCGPLHYRKVSDDLPFLTVFGVIFIFVNMSINTPMPESTDFAAFYIPAGLLRVYFNQMNTRFIRVLSRIRNLQPLGLFK